ncbi:MAG: hypothetical protein GQ565_02235 [Candidatus Aegiribacteria sp.]|nr:hypothetical protein [Candidatus Aegiribacteria sp.]
MTVTARKHAFLNRISPKVRHLAGFYLLELAVILSWTLLLDTVFNFISGNWFILLPLSYFLAVTMLAWLERSRTGSRGQCPLEAFGLAEISLNGFRPSEWQTLRRLLMTPPLMLLLCAGLVPVPRTGKTILQMISGTRIVPLDADMDPRPDEEIFRSRRKALMKVISYTMVSLMVTAVIILVPSKLSVVRSGGRISSVHSLPEKERELLASYLEMKAMYPNSLEYHVRLASLYYRNEMEEDLLLELEQIRRLDPDHSILILEEDLSVTMEDLMVEQDSTFADSIPVTITEETIPADEDTVAQDSVVLLPDSVSPDLSIVVSDSITAPVDSLSTADSMGIDDFIEVDSLILPTPEESLPETAPPPADETVQEPPVSSVTEDTTAVVNMDSTESSGGIEAVPGNPPGTSVTEDTTAVVNVDSTESSGGIEAVPENPPGTSVTEDTTAVVNVDSTESSGDIESSEPSGTAEETPSPDQQYEPEGT